MEGSLHRTALSAWNALKEIGGIEVEDRDADFEERLRVTLASDADTLAEALAAKSTDEFVRAFFAVLQPYSEMFRAILDYFQTAGARTGRNQWRIAVGEEHLSLRHFEEFVSTVDTLPGLIEAPAVDPRGLWAAWKVADELDNTKLVRPPLEDVADPAIADWLRAYDKGLYNPLPSSLHPDNVAPALRDTAALLLAAVDLIRRTWRDHAAMQAARRGKQFDWWGADAFHPFLLAAHESDYVLRNMATLISQYGQSDPLVQTRIDAGLRAIYDRYPRRRYGVAGTVENLERLLSLPVWRQRHELYAAWIATEIIAALSDHDCELYAEGEKLTFAARDAQLATIISTRPPVTICGERRSPLADPIGKGRTDNVQPDYTLWRGRAPDETCGFVVEVKHYKKNAPLKFREALIDYARAHRQAKVVLVSHGPALSPLRPDDRSVADRCEVIGELAVTHVERRQKFRTIVRDYVGDPVRPVIASEAGIIAVDISASMNAMLREPDFVQLLSQISANQPLTLVDSELRATISLGEYESVIQSLRGGSSERLAEVMRELLADNAEVTLITDKDGLNEVASLNVTSTNAHFVKTEKVFVLEVTR
jgi:hypothetical protein